jgi:alpha-methylacyl-CoA racemase
MPGPLEGTRIIEIAGIGPGPFCAMMLADMGADVIRVERAERVMGGDPASPPADVLQRGRRSIGVDLKNPDGVETVLALIESADALLEGFRPGVMERLGLGPDVALARNPRLVYGRMTGWGQDGPYAPTAGHDINYIALAGALDPIGRKGGPPVPPLNLVGDFGGGGMLLAYGLVCGIVSAQRTGQGQVVDAAMVDGAAILTTMFHAFRAMGIWEDARGSNLLDTGAHFYDVYETADGKYVSVGSIEPQFYAELVRLTGLEAEPDLPFQMDKTQWPAMKDRLAAIFKAKTRDEWCELMEGTDVCFAPVLGLGEAPAHPHNVHRQTFVELDGVVQPAPAPRFSGTPVSVQRPPSHAGQHTDEVLTEWGLDADRVAKLRDAGAIA